MELIYELSLDGQVCGTLTKQEFQTLRAETRKDPKVWLGVAIEFVGGLASFVGCLFRIWGMAAGFAFLLLASIAHKIYPDFLASTPQQIIEGLRLLGVYVVFGTALVATLGATLRSLVPGPVQMGVYDIALQKRIRTAKQISPYGVLQMLTQLPEFSTADSEAQQ